MQGYCRWKFIETTQEEKNRFSTNFSQNCETYAVNRFYTRNLFKAVWYKKHIFHELNCKIKLMIHITRCGIYRIQYIGKSKTEFNIRQNNHHKDVNRQNAPEADQHFKLPNHIFNEHVRYTLTEQLDNVNIDKDLATLWLNKTLHP